MLSDVSYHDLISLKPIYIWYNNNVKKPMTRVFLNDPRSASGLSWVTNTLNHDINMLLADIIVCTSVKRSVICFILVNNRPAMSFQKLEILVIKMMKVILCTQAEGH